MRQLNEINVYAGLASGADSCYIFEEPVAIEGLRTDLNNIISKMKNGGPRRGLVLRYV